MKKIIWVIWLMGLITISAFAEDVFDNEVTLVVDGIELNTYDAVQNINTPPFIYENRTMLPLRKTFELFGIKGDQIQWDGEERSITVYTNEGSRIWMQIDNTKLRFNQEIIETDVPVKLFENRTYVPLAHISKMLGVIPEWDGVTRTVTMSPSHFVVKDLNLEYDLPRKEGYTVPKYDDDFKEYIIKRWSNETRRYDRFISFLPVDNSFSQVIQDTAQSLNIRSDEFQVLNDDMMAVYYQGIEGDYTFIYKMNNRILLLTLYGMDLETIETFLRSMEASQ